MKFKELKWTFGKFLNFFFFCVEIYPETTKQQNDKETERGYVMMKDGKRALETFGLTILYTPNKND